MKRLLVLACILAGLGRRGGAGWSYTRVHEPYRGFTSAEQFVDIPPGTGAAAIGARLAEAGVVRDAETFRVALWLSGRARESEGGRVPVRSRAVAVGGDRSDRPRRRLQAADHVPGRPDHSRDGPRLRGARLRSSRRVRAGRPQRARLSPTSIPQRATSRATCSRKPTRLPRGTSADELVAQMVGLFKRLYAEPLRAEAAAAGLTTRQVVTLASLVEKETARPEERPLVGAVYRNRLKVGMGMQADPTVIYALQQAGQYDGNLSRDDLQFDSPYNTYRYAGPAAGADRLAGPGVARWPRSAPRRWRTCIS